MDDNEIEGLDEIFKNLDSFQLTSDERSQIIEPGAKILEQQLIDATPVDKRPNAPEYQSIYGDKIGKLKQGVTHKPKQYADGSTDIGFKRGYHNLANWVDHGTFRQHPQFFMEKVAQRDHTDAFNAQAEMATRIIDSKGE